MTTPASNPASSPALIPARNRPFKKFFCDDKEVFRLPGVAFKIWMYHYAREGKARQSWPTVDTICEALDINKSTLQRWRKFLVQTGWLEKVGEHRRLDGEFNVPIFKVKRGAVDEIISDGRRDNCVHRRRNNHLPTETNKSSATGTKISSPDRDEIIIHEVDTGLLDSEEVESGVLESTPAPSHSLSNPTPKASGKKKRLEDFPPVLETREEREEFRACLREMREAMNTTPVRKMDEDIGDVSELDAIPELDLDSIPELDLSKVPSLTA